MHKRARTRAVPLPAAGHPLADEGQEERSEQEPETVADRGSAGDGQHGGDDEEDRGPPTKYGGRQAAPRHRTTGGISVQRRTRPGHAYTWSRSLRPRQRHQTRSATASTIRTPNRTAAVVGQLCSAEHFCAGSAGHGPLAANTVNTWC